MEDLDFFNFDKDEDDEEDEDTHVPKYFIKDKNIIQLNDYPELINGIGNQAGGPDLNHE